MIYAWICINILSCSMQSNCVRELAGAKTVTVAQFQYMEVGLVYQKHDTIARITMAQGFRRWRRVKLEIGQTNLYDLSQNGNLHHIFKSLVSTQFSSRQIKNTVITYSLEIEE
jgi:hypothetical protein